MGHKVHPNGFRLGVSRTWNAKWYSDKEYTELLREDITIRTLVKKRLANASVSLVEIERGINHVTVTVHTAKPGIVIGKGGANVESLRQAVGKITDRKVKLEIAVNDEFKDAAVAAIVESARSGHIGDGKIFVMDMAECIRIRTSESGAVAIG